MKPHLVSLGFSVLAAIVGYAFGVRSSTTNVVDQQSVKSDQFPDPSGSPTPGPFWPSEVRSCPPQAVGKAIHNAIVSDPNRPADAPFKILYYTDVTSTLTPLASEGAIELAFVSQFDGETSAGSMFGKILFHKPSCTASTLLRYTGMTPVSYSPKNNRDTQDRLEEE